jgi:di/tricarboxylate transporter
MSPIVITLVLLLVAIVLFATEKIPVDVVGLLLVMALIITRVLTVQDAVAGFGNDIIITIAGLFVLVGGLAKTGLIDVIGRKMHELAGDNVFLLTTFVMIAAACGAAVLKNTTTTAMFLPIVLGLAVKAKIPPSKLLMPLAFGAILGGSCTLIGTSTNLAVSGAIKRYGQAPFSMFELAPVGIVTVAVGMLYMLTIGRRMLPSTGGEDSLTEQYQMREYISELIVLPDSPLDGKTIAEADLSQRLDLTVLGIIRSNGEKVNAPAPSERIRRRDSLIVEGKMADILRVKEAVGLEIKPDFLLSDRELEGGEIELSEVLVARDSALRSQTLRGLKFRERYELSVLAINRHGRTFVNKLSHVKLKFGDVLLVQGKRRGFEELVADNEVIVLEELSDKSQRVEKRPWAVVAFGLFLALSLSKVVVGVEVPLAIAVLSGVMVLLASRTIKHKELYTLINFRVLVLIACMMSFGTAMEVTGADKYLAALITENFGRFGPTAVLAGFFLLTVALTQPMSNQAAALVVLPVAVQAALTMGVNPRSFIVGITYAASFSFITPLEPACVLIYTPGRYSFMDFVKVGSILTVLVFLAAMLLVPVFWPL